MLLAADGVAQGTMTIGDKERINNHRRNKFDMRLLAEGGHKPFSANRSSSAFDD